MLIRNMTASDWDEVQRLYAYARDFMRRHGNPDQWRDVSPRKELTLSDIENGTGYVVEEDGALPAAFALPGGEDPTYARIYDGAWHYDRPYGTIHRIASYGGRGAASAAIRWCGERFDYLRIDTHRDNVPMRNLVKKTGFSYCGRIYIADGTERLAFDRLALK